MTIFHNYIIIKGDILYLADDVFIEYQKRSFILTQKFEVGINLRL